MAKEYVIFLFRTTFEKQYRRCIKIMNRTSVFYYSRFEIKVITAFVTDFTAWVLRFAFSFS